MAEQRGGRRKQNRLRGPRALEKAPTGIAGLDQVTAGGLPRARPTLVCGSAGCGKTLLAMEFLVRGATQFDEPGVFMSFEERSEELAANVASLGFDLEALAADKKLAIDHVRVERSEIEETGEYDLEGLFIRIGWAVDRIGARRIVLDTIEALFSGLSNPAILRAELRRLFAWLKERGLTAVITGERGEGQLTRHGLEEYVSDCVILLDHRVHDQLSTRRLRVVKYRGSTHGTNEYPFLIGDDGISVLPVTSAGLEHAAPTERVSTGIERLDAMLGGAGFYRGSSILVSGTAGTGKSSLAAHFLDAACRRGERCLAFVFEESPAQILRNMRSIGIDLEPWVKKGRLRFHAARPTFQGLEVHLTRMHREVDTFDPAVVTVDPITNLMQSGAHYEVQTMLLRLVDHLKTRGVTSLFTSLLHGPAEESEVGVSSLMDSWLLLRSAESSGERNRLLYVLKSRGMAHSNQAREFLLTDRGIELLDVYTGPAGVLTGSARLSREAEDEASALARRRAIERSERQLERQRAALEARIRALEAEFEAEKDEALRGIEEERAREQQIALDRTRMARSRRADAAAGRAPRGTTRPGERS
ncbi:MAG: KaiC 1 [Proteobacteria bacterium]|nr:MAG: KaiC 1 [Pseudomonadota bacterium]